MQRRLNPNIRVEPPKAETPNIAPPEKLDLVKLEREQIDQSKIDELAKNNPPAKLEMEQMDLPDDVNENDITYISNPSKTDDPPDSADIDWPDPLFMPPLSQANYPYPPDATEIAWTIAYKPLIDYLIKGGT